MAPTLLAGDYLIAVPIDTRGRVTRGSLVTYRDTRNSALMMLKRVVAIGGDTITMQRRQVILNGRTIDEPYARTVGTGPGALMDSRYTGFVPTGNIIGSPRRIYFSRDPDTGHVRWGRIGKRLR
jgi:signal peptidase I